VCWAAFLVRCGIFNFSRWRDVESLRGEVVDLCCLWNWDGFCIVLCRIIDGLCGVVVVLGGFWRLAGRDVKKGGRV
jgi:hypothetical protein